jgi:hypothetical protein
MMPAAWAPSGSGEFGSLRLESRRGLSARHAGHVFAERLKVQFSRSRVGEW